MLLRYSTALLAALLFGCSGSDPVDERPAAPPGTGLVTVDLRGDWEVTAVETLEQVGGVGPFRPGRGFAPPVVGARFSIALPAAATAEGVASLSYAPSLAFIEIDGAGASREACEGDGISVTGRYLNQVDGRFALFDRDCGTRYNPGIVDGGSFRLTCAFGTVTADRMYGAVSFASVSMAMIPESAQSGSYLVTVERVR